MEFQSKRLFEEYNQSNEKSYNFLMRAVEIMKILLNRNFDSFIIGSAVRNLYLSKDIDSIEIKSKGNDSILNILIGKEVRSYFVIENIKELYSIKKNIKK